MTTTATSRSGGKLYRAQFPAVFDNKFSDSCKKGRMSGNCFIRISCHQQVGLQTHSRVLQLRKIESDFDKTVFYGLHQEIILIIFAINKSNLGHHCLQSSYECSNSTRVDSRKRLTKLK